MTASSMPNVPSLRIAAVRSTEKDGQRIRSFGHDNQMDVIRHQTIAKNLYASLLVRFPYQLKVKLAISDAFEHSLAVSPSLGYVIRYSR